MKILIAEDNVVSRRVLQLTLTNRGHEVVVAQDGNEAWAELQKEDAPQLAVLDWMMPGIDGVELCRRIRQMPKETPTYIILLTAKSSKEEIVEGLDAGANDYVTKPFDRNELRARVQVGETVLRLEKALAERVRELEGALIQVKQLQGILPICSYCKNVRDDQNYWQKVESYVSNHSEASFSHSICPQCYETVVKPDLAKRKADRAAHSGEEG
ncbi:MAG: response regulator transcription factor [Pyrinomonadaceae bacterium]